MRLLPGTNKVPLPEELCDIYRMWLNLDGLIYSVAHVSNDVMASIKGHESIVAPDITRGPPECVSVFREPDGSRKLVLHPVPDKEYDLIVRYTVVKEL